MSTSAELADAIAAAGPMGAGHLLPILRGVRRGALVAVFGLRGAAIPMGRLKREPRPALVLLGDDDAAPTGPAGWPQTEKLLQWAAGAVVHSTGATVDHYAAAVGLALLHRRVLLIETSTAQEPAWLGLIRRLRPGLPGLIVRTRPGAPAHPLTSVPDGAMLQ